MAIYIDARIKMNSNNFEDALFEVLSLLNKKPNLPKPIELECQKMLAKIHMNLGHKDVALAAFEHIANLPLSLGEQTYARSNARRIRFSLNFTD